MAGVGVPRGRVVEIFGPESSGKTTLTLHIIASAQKNGGVAAFIEALDRGRHVVEFLPDLMTDPIDRDTVQSEDESGIYSADELEVVE